jgi:hypothetical protein
MKFKSISINLLQLHLTFKLELQNISGNRRHLLSLPARQECTEILTFTTNTLKCRLLFTHNLG